jgi:hypothetical protein
MIIAGGKDQKNKGTSGLYDRPEAVYIKIRKKSCMFRAMDYAFLRYKVGTLLSNKEIICDSRDEEGICAFSKWT